MNCGSESNLTKLVKLAESIADDPALIAEMAEEIQTNNKKILCRMIKQQFKNNLLKDLGPISEFIHCFFTQKKITEVNIYDSEKLGIKCFFMPKNTLFPLHDHPNQVICSGIIYGNVRYLTLNPHVHKNWYKYSKKGICKTGGVLFATKKYRNIHSIMALQDSIMIDIFIPNYMTGDDLGLFHVKRKRGRDFLLEKFVVKVKS